MQRTADILLVLVIAFLLGIASQIEEQTPFTLDPPSINAIDLSQMLTPSTSSEKKERFFALLKPLVEIENQYIKQVRSWLNNLNLRNLSSNEKKMLIQVAKQYQIDSKLPLPTIHARLLNRVNIIPVELVLVQAANESAWGQSRFAQKANNLFGQWCFSKGCGVVPAERPKGKTYEVAKFNSVQLSIRAYLHNLNTFSAYKELRAQRALAATQKQPITAQLLAQSLTRYSQRGQAYVDEIIKMITINQKLIAQIPSQY